MERFGRGRFGDSDEERLERLMDAGFSADRAMWINQRTAELRMEALQAQYDAARDGHRCAEPRPCPVERQPVEAQPVA